MKGQSTWSYRPFRPILWDVGAPYICRIVPSPCGIHVEWLPENVERYDVFIRKIGEGEFAPCGGTSDCFFDIRNLECGIDYEFYVTSGEKKSRTRLARCGSVEGSVVNYLHPLDGAYAFSGQYLASPSLLMHPDGYLLASMDVYLAYGGQNLSFIFRSDDGGENWYYVNDIMPSFWGKLFLHRGDVYMLTCSTEYGDLLIGKSTDGGKSFSPPVTLLRGLGGKGPKGGIKKTLGVHKNPQNIVQYRGRIYETLEWGSWHNDEYYHAAMVMSCDENDDLLCPESWHFTEPLKYDPTWEGTAPDGVKGCIEGTLCIAPDGDLYTLMRYQTEQKKILAFRVQTEGPDLPLVYSHAIDFPGNLSKFMVKYDERTKRYYSIICRRIDQPVTRRNLLSLVASEDLRNWSLVTDLLDYRNASIEEVGFQYVDFEFDGEDLIYLCRTSLNGANTYHNSNYSTFHRLSDFRSLECGRDIFQ